MTIPNIGSPQMPASPPPAPIYGIPDVFKSGDLMKKQAFGKGKAGGTIVTGGQGVEGAPTLGGTILTGGA